LSLVVSMVRARSFSAWTLVKLIMNHQCQLATSIAPEKGVFTGHRMITEKSPFSEGIRLKSRVGKRSKAFQLRLGNGCSEPR